jgi:hypothetical protein
MSPDLDESTETRIGIYLQRETDLVNTSRFDGFSENDAASRDSETGSKISKNENKNRKMRFARGSVARSGASYF